MELFGVTTPLITTADGAKMGKTAQGAVWLDEKLLSPYDYWQFWRNTQDADVGRFLKLFTDLSLEDIGRLESLDGAEINQAKIVLATEATALLHGRKRRLRPNRRRGRRSRAVASVQTCRSSAQVRLFRSWTRLPGWDSVLPTAKPSARSLKAPSGSMIRW